MEVLNDTLPIYLEGSLSKEIEKLPKLCEETQKPSFFYSQKSKQKTPRICREDSQTII